MKRHCWRGRCAYTRQLGSVKVLVVEVVVEKQCWSCVGGGGAPGELAGDCQSGVYA